MGDHGENLQRGRPAPNCRSVLSVDGGCEGGIALTSGLTRVGIVDV